MAKFRPVKGLNQRVAELIAPTVQEIVNRVAEAAASYAPQVKVWRTMGDERVRPWHVSANDQAVPGNLRFKLEHSPRTYLQYHPPGYELLRFPRDPKAYYLQTRDCRCFMRFNDALAESIVAGPVRVSGTRVRGRVSTSFPRAAESEFGTDEDVPARFMGQGIRDVAARL